MKARTTSLDRTISSLRQMTVAQLRDRYLEVFGEPTGAGNKDFLFKRIAWRMQSLSEGSLSQRARDRALQLAHDADVRTTAPRAPRAMNGGVNKLTLVRRPAAHDRLPVSGTVLTRKYRGRRIDVKVLADGFEHDGQVYRSLSAVARAVTGSHWNGHLFFGLTGAASRKDVRR